MSRMTFDVYDGVAPTVGLYLLGAKKRHVVTAVRPVDSRIWHDRWALEVRRLGPDEVVPPGARTWTTYSYEPGYCPACIAREVGAEVPDYVVHRCGAA